MAMGGPKEKASMTAIKLVGLKAKAMVITPLKKALAMMTQPARRASQLANSAAIAAPAICAPK